MSNLWIRVIHGLPGSHVDSFANPPWWTSEGLKRGDHLHLDLRWTFRGLGAPPRRETSAGEARTTLVCIEALPGMFYIYIYLVGWLLDCWIAFHIFLLHILLDSTLPIVALERYSPHSFRSHVNGTLVQPWSRLQNRSCRVNSRWNGSVWGRESRRLGQIQLLKTSVFWGADSLYPSMCLTENLFLFRWVPLVPPVGEKKNRTALPRPRSLVHNTEPARPNRRNKAGDKLACFRDGKHWVRPTLNPSYLNEIVATTFRSFSVSLQPKGAPHSTLAFGVSHRRQSSNVAQTRSERGQPRVAPTEVSFNSRTFSTVGLLAAAFGASARGWATGRERRLNRGVKEGPCERRFTTEGRFCWVKPTI